MSNILSEELAELVCSHFAGTKAMQRSLGVPLQIGRVWLDIIFPFGPPPEYERSGYARTPVEKRDWLQADA